MKKILLIEDDQTMRSLLKTLLELEGFQVIICPDGENQTIFTFVIDTMPDVAILDVNLRNASGLKILTLIRSDVRSKNMRILMSSGMNMKDECLLAGADFFLLKPYMPDELISQLKKL